MSNIQKTKHHLTLTFTIIVFIVILSFGVIFFTTKYIKGYTVEKNNFSRTTQSINSNNIRLKSILEFQEQLRRSSPRISGSRPKLEKELLGRGGINFILLNNKSEILSHNVKVEVGDHFLEEVLDLKHFSKVKLENDFLLTKIPFQEKFTLVLFQKIRYNLGDYLADLLLFLLLSTLLSGLIYITGRFFVNKTFVPVEENIDDMKNFVHNAGHELKTPLAVIDSNLQLMNEDKNCDTGMIGENRSELKKLNSLIDSLIQLTDIDSLKTKEEVNLKEIVEEITQDYKQKIKDKEIDCKIKIRKDIIINTNKDYLYIFLSNLIGNAIKYNIKKGKIRIHYIQGELIIKDTGIGIKNGDQEKIWNRFFQADSSRSGEGFGIGLSLVKKISEIYKWKISLKSEEGKGTDVKIVFR